MTDKGLSHLNLDSLVSRFVENCLAQDRALLYSEYAEYGRLYKRMRAIEDELKGRSGDQRRALSILYSHSNAQVRFQAAGATLALEPGLARQIIESIANSNRFPHAGYAGMMLDALDSGTFKPT